MVSFTGILKTLPVTTCLGSVIPNLFWSQTQCASLRGQETWHLNLKLVHLRYVTLILLGSNLGGMVEAAGVG
ncbi:unnamed protein product [Gulo gulo]|uniref:Uncharacterized protein n=1 Tax=Gulo gulo TaxID=48420 RepID=A0A9X9Q6L3_GULGU|nr:unnamed protein product [Gulo gulo]